MIKLVGDASNESQVKSLLESEFKKTQKSNVKWKEKLEKLPQERFSKMFWCSYHHYDAFIVMFLKYSITNNWQVSLTLPEYEFSFSTAFSVSPIGWSSVIFSKSSGSKAQAHVPHSQLNPHENSSGTPAFSKFFDSFVCRGNANYLTSESTLTLTGMSGGFRGSFFLRRGIEWKRWIWK